MTGKVPFKNKLNSDGKIDLIDCFAEEYLLLAASGAEVPRELSFVVKEREENLSVERGARKAALKSLISEASNADLLPNPFRSSQPIVKVAFDTRRFDQETIRNPRSNLQNWVRSEQFISDATQDKINIFAKMLKPLDELKTSFGAQPEWHNSYSRTLHDAVYRILRVKEADLDIFEPQLAYLEQLMFNRYRLSMEEISRKNASELKEIFLKKDESLMKRGAFLHTTQGELEKNSQQALVVKDGNGKSLGDSLVTALFGNNDFRREGEKKVSRTITITITDEAAE